VPATALVEFPQIGEQSVHRCIEVRRVLCDPFPSCSSSPSMKTLYHAALTFNNMRLIPSLKLNSASGMLVLS
jgi:hypothetical protein